MLPHHRVHRGGDHNGLIGGEQRGGGQILRQAVSHLRDHICARRGDDDEVGLAGEANMPHLALLLEVPEIGIDFLFRQGRDAHGGDELRSAICEDAAHMCAGLPQQPDQSAALIGRNTAADDEEDGFVMELRHGLLLFPRMRESTTRFLIDPRLRWECIDFP